MADQLAIDLFINEAKASAAVDRVKSKLVETDKVATNFGSSFASKFDIQVELAQQKLAALARQKAVLEGRQGSGISNIGDFRASQALQTRNAALSPFLERAAAGGSREAFDLTKAKAATLEGIADLEKVASARAATAGKVTGKQFAAAFGPAAQNVGQDLAQGGSVGTAVLSNASSLATGVSTVFSGAFLAVAGSVAVLGVAAVAASKLYREAAEKELAVIFKIQAAVNQSILVREKAREDAQKAIKQADEATANQGKFDGFDIASLNRQLETKQSLLNITPDIENIEKYTADIIQLKAKIADLFKSNSNAENAGFEQRSINFQQQQDTGRKIEENRRETEAKRLADIKIAKEKVEELGKTYTSVLDGLFQRANSNNPFVLLYSEADRSLKALRENTRGLSADVISQFEKIEQRANALKLFELRADNALAAVSLRRDARSFTDPTQEERQKRLDAKIAEFERTSNSTNPDVVRGFQKDQQFINDTPKRLLQEFLDKSVNSLPAGATPEQRAALDRKILQLTQGVNPNDLRGDQRQLAADVREREAIRLENAETAAQKERIEQSKLQKQIADNTKRLIEIATKQGVKGIDLLIKTDDGVSDVQKNPKAPTQDDTKRLYSIGLSSGAGGLSSF